MKEIEGKIDEIVKNDETYGEKKQAILELFKEKDEEIERLIGTIGSMNEVLGKINMIRNSIIGLQNINWSEHIYPLVEALNDAGIEGMSYPKARKYYVTLLEENTKLKERIDKKDEVLDKFIASYDFIEAATKHCGCDRCKKLREILKLVREARKE